MTTVNTQAEAATRNPNEAATHGQSFDTITDIQILDIVVKNAERKAKGATRERWMLNRSKLFSACCAEIKSLAGQDKLNRLPSTLATKVEAGIDAFLTEKINSVTPTNVISVNRAFKHDFNNLQVVERVTVNGQNTVSMKEQKFGITLLITQQEERLKRLQSKPTPDYDAEKNCKLSLSKLQLTQQHIAAEIAKLETVTGAEQKQ